MIRPDGRRFVRVAELPELPEGEVYCTVLETDAESPAHCERLGFVVSRRESHYLVRTDAVRAAVPKGVRLVTADEVDLDCLRLLDDALRQDAPGTDGWRWDEEGFRAQLDDAYDPATYLVAVDAASGEYVGLVRIWHNPAGPRLGMIGVLPGYRRRVGGSVELVRRARSGA